MPQIMTVADIESYCRMSLRQASKHAALAIRVAIAASMAAGNDWVSVANIQSKLAGAGKTQPTGRGVAERLESLGLAERRVESVNGRRTYQIKLRSNLFDLSHFHGGVSDQVRSALEVYCSSRRRATPLVALLLIGIYAFQIKDSKDLGLFLKPELEVEENPSSTTRLLNQLHQAGLITIMRTHKSRAKPYTVIPVGGR